MFPTLILPESKFIKYHKLQLPQLALNCELLSCNSCYLIKLKRLMAYWFRLLVLLTRGSQIKVLT